MPMIAHVFRRGAVYTWRRRVPVRSGNATKAGYIQVSLHTHDPAKARVIGAALHATSERAFELMAASRLTAEQARTWLEHVVKKELDAIDNRRLAEHDDISGGGYEDNRLLDELAAHCFRLLASQGKSAAFDPSRDKALAARGFSEEEIERGGYLLDIYKRDFWSDARHGKTVREAGRVLGQDEISSLVYMELRRIQMEGKSVALSASLNPDDDRLGDAIAAASKVIEARESARRNIFADGTAAAPQGQDAALGGATPEPEAISVKQVEPFVFQGSSYSDDITDVIDRLKAIKKREGADEKALRQFNQVFGVFREITGVQKVQELRQHHFARYVDTLGELPKTYRKSPRDRNRPLIEILEEARDLPDDKKGMSASTLNRNLTFLGMLLQKARSEGHDVDPKIDLKGLKPRKTVKARDEKRAYTPEEVQKIFQHPMWTGCVGKRRRRVPGSKIIKDGRYWVPLILALTGARREEIAGIKAREIVQVDGIWCFDIKPNANRGLKNAQSKRRVPVHGQLLDLGLIKYARSRRGVAADLFPELKPSVATKSFGEQVYASFDNAMHDQISDVDKKSLHSFRHYVTDVINNSAAKTEHRNDLLGHLGEGMGAVRYGSGTDMANLRATVDLLPRIAALEPFCQTFEDGSKS